MSSQKSKWLILHAHSTRDWITITEDWWLRVNFYVSGCLWANLNSLIFFIIISSYDELIHVLQQQFDEPKLVVGVMRWRCKLCCCLWLWLETYNILQPRFQSVCFWLFCLFFVQLLPLPISFSDAPYNKRETWAHEKYMRHQTWNRRQFFGARL